MKKLIMFLVIGVMLVMSAAAAYVPDNEVCENRNGRQLIIKTFTLAPTDSPDTLIEEPFEREGYSYSYISIVKDEKAFESKKVHSETMTVETDSKDLSVILAALEATLPYDDGEYSGILALDHTSLQTEVTGYSTKSYTVSDTKTFEGLERNDPSYIPKTTVKNGVTLNLQSIEWSVQGTALADDVLVPSQYMATAKYSASASSKVANGYISTATYTGEIVSSGIGAVVYTVTYIGEPIPTPTPEPEAEPLSVRNSNPAAMYFIISGIMLLLLTAGITAYFLLRKNTKVYTLTESGDEYELIGRQWLNARNMAIDLPSFNKYPYSEAVVEINSRTARRLFGRLIRIRLRNGTVTHRIEQNGNDSYWFTVSTLTQEVISE